MAVTEAGCDLTYCRMRGIVAVLTGEHLTRAFTHFRRAFVNKQQKLCYICVSTGSSLRADWWCCGGDGKCRTALLVAARVA